MVFHFSIIFVTNDPKNYSKSAHELNPTQIEKKKTNLDPKMKETCNTTKSAEPLLATGKNERCWQLNDQ